MSQRECAGFNWPGFAVSTGEPIARDPVVGRSSPRTPRQRSASVLLPSPVRAPLSPSVARGVGHEQRCTAALFSCSPFAPPPLSA